MKRMNKKGFAVTVTVYAILLVVALVVGVVGTIVAGQLFGDKNPIDEPPQPVPKSCLFVEDEEKCDGGVIVNPPPTFAERCNQLYNEWGSMPYFVVKDSVSGSFCMSCEEYSKDGEGRTISKTWFWSKELCEQNIHNPSPDCYKITSKADCKDISKNVKPLCDFTKYEEFCREENECPDLKLFGAIPFPDIYCKIKVAVKGYLLPLRIAMSIIGAFLAYFFVSITLHKVKKDNKKAIHKDIILPVSIIAGLLVGSLLWFYFIIGLLLLIAVMIVKLFVW